MTIALLAAISCFSAAPSECIEAAEETGLPDEVIERLRNPGDLNAIERAALNRILSEAGIDDLCQIASNADPGSSETSENSKFPNLDGINPFQRGDEESAETDKSSSGDKEPVESKNSEERRETIEQTIAAAQRSARIPRNEEHRRRCQFWALNNLEPVVYEEFAELNPDSMDDLDRILWRTKLNPDERLGYYDDDDVRGDVIPSLRPSVPEIYCRDYWARPLNRNNAHLRNHGFEPYCRAELEERITYRFGRLADAVNYDDDNELVYQTPNQYVRILQWLDISGGDLMNSDNPPYRILQEQSRHLYAYWADSVPTEESLEDYRRETGTRLNLEWLGILTAAGMGSNSSEIDACRYYYPQVFYGYWVPFDPDRIPDNNQERAADLPKYEASTTPLFLPKTVSANRVRAGYPLGRTAGYYHLCRDSSEAEAIGYYYVDHPVGDYCEKIP